MKKDNRFAEYVEAEDKLFNFRPVFFAAIFLCLGIIAAFNERYGNAYIGRLAVMIPLFALLPVLFYRGKRRSSAIAAFVLCGVAFFTGLACFHAQMNDFEDKDILAQKSTVCGTVVRVSKEKYSTTLLLEDIVVDDERLEGALIAYLPTSFDGEFAICSEVVLSGKLWSKGALRENGSFDAYSVGENVRYAMTVSNGIASGYKFELFGYLRARLAKVLYEGMDERTASVTLAVLTGDVSGMDDELLTNMRFGGIAHVFAVSGLHIGCLFAFCLSLIEHMGGNRVKRIWRFLFTAGVLLFYGGICGYTPSVVRSFVTCLTFYGASLLFIDTDFLNTLGFAAIVILLGSPSSLFETGFILSFTACLGIGLLARPVREIIERGYECVELFFTKKRTPFLLEDRANKPLSVYGRVRKGCISFLSVTISAQLATAPIGLLCFGYVSTASLFLNCLFVPLVSAVFASLLLVSVLAVVLPFLVKPLLYLPYVVWSALLLIFDTVDFSLLTVRDLPLSTLGLACYYLSLIFLTDKWNISKRLQRWLFGILLFAFVFIVAMAYLR